MNDIPIPMRFFQFRNVFIEKTHNKNHTKTKSQIYIVHIITLNIRKLTDLVVNY